MKTRALLSALSLLAITATPAAAQTRQIAPAMEPSAGDDLDRPQWRGTVVLHSRFGVARTPFAAPLWPEQTAYRAFVFIPEASYALRPSFYVGLRVPWVEVFVERPAGSIVKQGAFGNPELSAAWQYPVTNQLHGTVRFSAGFPSEGSINPEAAHYPNAALALGSALEGWRHPELFAPGRLPLTPSAALDYHLPWFHAGLELKLPFLIQLESAAAAAAVEVNPIAIVPVLRAQASVNPFDWLYITTHSWLAWQAILPAQLAGHERSRVQLVVQPQLGFAIGRHVLLAIDSTLPVGGELGGGVYSGALSACARF